ncbi:hypothetical protein AAG570_003531 [Ranatra chinensis]|uniref:Peroxisome assembly protein 12 n=1 Tax=Ranatra chinensis TaxID=642074 RepID=A0ABD0Y3Y4_9HEMI
MAENAAHISTIPQAKPTIFEVVAQESLLATLKPSLRILCEAVVGTNPERYRKFLAFYDELYLLFDCFLQHHYLKTSQASFSEAFYGLKRISNKGDGPGLSTRERYLSLALLVGFPYLRHKLQELTNNIQTKTYATHLTAVTRCLQYFVKGVKTLNLSFECLKLYYYLRYLSGHYSSHSPLLALAGVQLVYQKHDPSKITWKDLFNFVRGRNQNITLHSFPIFVNLLMKSLEMIAFFIQFLKWWHTDELRTKLNIYPIPKPPTVCKAPLDKCPLCLKQRKIEVALQTSGYVFCYNCIKHWLESNKRCPITNTPSSVHDLIRLYPTEDEC